MRQVTPPLRARTGRPTVAQTSHADKKSTADPAPSRLSYRFQRLWLTPFFRIFLRIGLPVFVAVFTMIAVFSDEVRRDAATLKFTEFRRSIEERPEFMVNLMAIDGASEELSLDIREVVSIDFPLSSFDFDLGELQHQVADLSAVAQVDVRIRPGGILQFEIVERIPAVVWRNRQAIEMLDGDGNRVAGLIARAQRPDLPLLAGAGADLAVPEALALLTAAAPIKDRVRGLIRRGERRWDVVLDRDQRILLPAIKPVAALERVMALNTVKDMLGRDLVAIDMRLKNRPTLRMASEAAEDMWDIRRLEIGALTR